MKNFVSLNVAEQLKRFPGPIRIIRRSLDEMITTELDSVQSNRGNHLLVEILQHRYPHICQKEPLETLWTYLSYEGSRQSEMLNQLKVEDDILTLLPEDKSYPSSFGNDSEDKIGEEDKKKIILQLVSITNLAFLEILNKTCFKENI